MPANKEFVDAVVSSFIQNVRSEIDTNKSVIDSLSNNINALRIKVLDYSSDLYITELIHIILKQDASKMQIPESILKDIDKNNANKSYDFVKIKSSLVVTYVLEVVNLYKQLQVAKERLEYYTQFENIDEDSIKFVLKCYFNNVQKSILAGENYGRLIPQFTIKIVRKPTIKKNKPNLGIKKVDWGASLKYLKEKAAELDPSLLKKYEAKLISRDSFINSMSKYNIKWHIYLDKEYSYWVDLHHRYCNNPNSHLYNIVPTNLVRNSTRSQIDFTNQNGTVEQIIETDELGLRDKILALERVDEYYCTRTFELYPY